MGPGRCAARPCEPSSAWSRTLPAQLHTPLSRPGWCSSLKDACYDARDDAEACASNPACRAVPRCARSYCQPGDACCLIHSAAECGSTPGCASGGWCGLAYSPCWDRWDNQTCAQLDACEWREWSDGVNEYGWCQVGLQRARAGPQGWGWLLWRESTGRRSQPVPSCTCPHKQLSASAGGHRPLRPARWLSSRVCRCGGRRAWRPHLPLPGTPAVEGGGLPPVCRLPAALCGAHCPSRAHHPAPLHSTPAPALQSSCYDMCRDCSQCMSGVAALPAYLAGLKGDTSKYAAAVRDFCLQVRQGLGGG